MRMSKKSSTFAAANKNKGLMKKYLLIAVACLSLVLGFSSCKVENSQVTVSVTDTEGAPVANRKVYYVDLASSIIDIFTPDPTDPLKEDDERLEEVDYVVTNAQGTVTFNIPLMVKSLDFYFYVFDEGSRQWQEKTVKIHRGVNADVEFVVNR